MNQTRKYVMYALCFLALGIAACSSGPSDEEMKQLQALQDEITQLQKEVATKQSQKTALQKQIAEKEAQLVQAAEDHNATKERLKSQQ